MDAEPEQITKLKERILELEVKVGTLSQGSALIWQCLEIQGFIKNGEIVASAASGGIQFHARWDPSKVKWEKREGPKGMYERSEDVDNPDFQNMLKDLAAHDGKKSRGGYFYWVFTNRRVVGRKRK